MKKTYLLKNRSAGMAGYRVPELNIRREIAPGQVIKVSAEEIEKLLFQDGGRTLLEQYLQIMDDEAIQEYEINADVEYSMSEAEIIELIKTGSLDEFLDALDFAPQGVIDLIKTFAVQLPMTDNLKRDAVKEKLGFDVDAAIRHMKEDEEESKENAPTDTKKTRRVNKNGEEVKTTTRRRATKTENKS